MNTVTVATNFQFACTVLLEKCLGSLVLPIVTLTSKWNGNVVEVPQNHHSSLHTVCIVMKKDVTNHLYNIMRSTARKL